MNKQKHRRIAGFSMIELLVAVLVMGIGVLGITGLQVASMQNNREALLRGEAAQPMGYSLLRCLTRIGHQTTRKNTSFDE